ncbi:hypothetical protein DD237_008063 [Peronospora effusa]|uniref:Protein kinase domain-containing protein n=1 Tax=Peronospora effusa TaxID=542832 RepID=A0A425C6M7_9STRA|nr:hypothetical protein DD237_008063 [Peronospora effusa]
MKHIWRYSGLLLLLQLNQSRAADCSALKQNLLTSSGCPSNCAANPCVLYSPSQKECIKLGSSGPCYSDSKFEVPGTNTECNLTYQCLDTLLWDKNQWLLALEANANTEDKTMAYVTQIADLSYSSSTLSVYGAPTESTDKNNIKNILLDQTFFNTPKSVVSMFLISVNLRKIISSVSLVTTYSVLYLKNTNLVTVPEQMSYFSALVKLDLSMNYILDLPVSTSKIWTGLSTVTDLNLADNMLTDFPVVLNKLQTLNLTGNPYTSIPDNVFSMAESGALKYLYMTSCKLMNVQVSASQLALLQNLAAFDADVTITDCGSGYSATTLNNANVQVCVGSTSSNGGSSHTLPIVLDLGSSLTGGDTTFGSSIWNDPDLLAARIEHRDVEAVKLLSRGGFGEVWLGLYMNENVAIKRLLGDKKTMQDALAFATEIKVMARLEHPKIVRFIGVSWTNALTIQAVTEFMDCGDLKSLLDSSRASSLTWANLKCQIAIDIADALVYMHTLNPKLIHRDLKSRNVLIDAQSGAKLSDFGISRNRSFDETMTAGVGTARWIAPEVILGGHYTEFADIYSFGVVLSELDTCKAPFYDATNTNGGKMQDVTILQLVSAGKLQPSFNESCPSSIVKLARACLSFDHAQRPSAIHISYELRKIMKDEL